MSNWILGTIIFLSAVAAAALSILARGVWVAEEVIRNEDERRG